MEYYDYFLELQQGHNFPALLLCLLLVVNVYRLCVLVVECWRDRKVGI